MGLLSNIGNWFKHFFNTVKTDLETFASHAWTLLEPFIQAFFTEAEKEIIATLQTLALTAIQQVASQGMPTDKAKQDAFAQIMSDAVKAQGIQLTDSMTNWLREQALVIYKDWQAKQSA